MPLAPLGDWRKSKSSGLRKYLRQSYYLLTSASLQETVATSIEMSDLIVSAGMGMALGICLVTFNTRNSKFYLENYESNRKKSHTKRKVESHAHDDGSDSTDTPIDGQCSENSNSCNNLNDNDTTARTFKGSKMRSNPSVETLEMLYGVKETDVLQDQNMITESDKSGESKMDHLQDSQPQEVDIDSNPNNSQPSGDEMPADVSLDDIKNSSIIDLIMFSVMVGFIGYAVNEATDGDFMRIIVAIFSKEFEALGLKEYFERVRIEDMKSSDL